MNAEINHPADSWPVADCWYSKILQKLTWRRFVLPGMLEYARAGRYRTSKIAGWKNVEAGRRESTAIQQMCINKICQQ